MSTLESTRMIHSFHLPAGFEHEPIIPNRGETIGYDAGMGLELLAERNANQIAVALSCDDRVIIQRALPSGATPAVPLLYWGSVSIAPRARFSLPLGLAFSPGCLFGCSLISPLPRSFGGPALLVGWRVVIETAEWNVLENGEFVSVAVNILEGIVIGLRDGLEEHIDLVAVGCEVTGDWERLIISAPRMNQPQTSGRIRGIGWR
jgi:hypothetical protein